MRVGPRAFVIGHPVAHSRSPLIHGHWLAEFGLAGSYERIDVLPGDVPAFLAGVATRGFVGGNVTIPHKEAAFASLDVATPRARRLGAANTLWLEGGRLHGDNTDGEGFVASVEEAVGAGALAGIGHAIVVGAGGAARAIAPALVERGVGRVTICNRNRARADEVARLATGIRALDWAELGRVLGEADLLVNTTQLGMDGEPALDLDLMPLPDHAIVADIVYVPLRTPLLEAARARRLRTVDGLGMLLHQAVPGFARWFGRTPAVTHALRARVEADLAGG